MQKVFAIMEARATQTDVERAIADWLDDYGRDRESLSAWEAHCFAMVLTFVRYGYYDRALDRLAAVIEPPTPLPLFPTHHLMSLEQLLRAMPASVREHRIAREERDGRDERAVSSGGS